MQCLMLLTMLPVCIQSQARKRAEGTAGIIVTWVVTEGFWSKLTFMTAFGNIMGLLLLLLNSCLSYNGTMDRYLRSLAWAEQIRIPAAGFFPASQDLRSELLFRALNGCKKNVRGYGSHTAPPHLLGNTTGHWNHSREAQTLRSLRLFLD